MVQAYNPSIQEAGTVGSLVTCHKVRPYLKKKKKKENKTSYRFTYRESSRGQQFSKLLSYKIWGKDV
jgi:hypothetical protein